MILFTLPPFFLAVPPFFLTVPPFFLMVPPFFLDFTEPPKTFDFLSIDGDNMSIDGGKKWYKGTEGLWELLTKRVPENYKTEDFDIVP